jgi:hypothetical protein
LVAFEAARAYHGCLPFPSPLAYVSLPLRASFSAISALHGTPATHHHAAITPYPHPSLTVVPLIGDQRYYGEVTEGSGTGWGGRVGPKASLFAETGLIRPGLAGGMAKT